MLQQQTSLTVGTRVTVSWPGRLGIEGTVGYVPSSLWRSDYGFAYPGHVLTVSATALLRVTGPAARTAFHVGAGVSVVGRGGRFVQELEQGRIGARRLW